jgi:hypothetical protein
LLLAVVLEHRTKLCVRFGRFGQLLLAIASAANESGVRLEL